MSRLKPRHLVWASNVLWLIGIPRYLIWRRKYR